MFKIFIIIIVVAFIAWITYYNYMDTMIVSNHLILSPTFFNDNNFQYLPRKVQEQIMNKLPPSPKKRVQFADVVDMRIYDTATGDILSPSTKIPLRKN